MDCVRHASFKGLCASLVRYLAAVYALSVSASAASAEPPPALSDAIRKYMYQFVSDVPDNSPFRFALEDLNGDGRADAIVLMSGPRWCGSGGCTMLILQGVDNGFEFVCKSTITSEPIRVSKKTVHGWRTLIVYSKTKGNVLMPLHEWRRYPLNPSMQPRASRAEMNAAEIVIE
jgi:hypothetical protein